MTDLFGGELTWTCHVCKAERPDERISVLKHEREVDLTGTGFRPMRFTENVRYCNDRPECVAGAKAYHHVQLMEGERLKEGGGG